MQKKSSRPSPPRPAGASRHGIFDADLDKNLANYQSLTPLHFLERAAAVFPDQVAVIDGSRRFTWAQTRQRCLRLASALKRRGIGEGDTVAVMAPNITAAYEAHFGVPMTGAVLNPINTRLDAKTIAYILDHGESKVLITDSQSATTMREALRLAGRQLLVIDIQDIEGDALGPMDYEAFLESGDASYVPAPPHDEWAAISLSYTSGTTGKPKGVVYHHRGAYLNALSNALGWQLENHPVYLWTLPMFHCNGWCFPWTMAAVAGTNVCMRSLTGANIHGAIDAHQVTHFCAAPVVLNSVINTEAAQRRHSQHLVRVMTAASPPPPTILAAMESRGFAMTHVYGLTETYGPAVICDWHDEWDQLDDLAKADQKSRQGVRYHVLHDLCVMDSKTMSATDHDGATLGEVMFRGNIVMKGYLKDSDATAAAFDGGWFHSGDIGVCHPDNYIQLRDRSKDIIISGGENISSIEIEDTLYRHPNVFEAAVVARPDDKWGETPCAFITLHDADTATTSDDIIAFCRANLAGFKIPKTVIFGPLPKTATGKIQKFKLRERAQSLDDGDL